MDRTWTLGVLPPLVENVQWLAGGEEDTVHDAIAAAADAVVTAARQRGRQEYRLTVAGLEIMLIPGADAHGALDLDELRADVHEFAARAW